MDTADRRPFVMLHYSAPNNDAAPIAGQTDRCPVVPEQYSSTDLGTT